MRRGHGQLFRQKFEPIAQIGDIVCLRTQDGFVTDSTAQGSPFYVVTAVGSTGHALGVKGILGIWAATAALGSPYKADSACVQGQNLNFEIPAGSQVALSPAAWQLQTRQLMQMRSLIRSIPDSNGAFVGSIDDFDFTINASGAAASSWGTQKLGGVGNSRFQPSLDADAIPAPVAGASMTRSLNPKQAPFDGPAAATETFLYSTLGATVVLTNNGVLTTTGAIGLETRGFPINIFPVPGTVRDGWFLGYDIKVPVVHPSTGAPFDLDDVIVIPVSPQSTPKSAGS